MGTVVELNNNNTFTQKKVSKLSSTLKKISMSQKKQYKISCVNSPSLSVISNTRNPLLDIITPPTSLQLERNQRFAQSFNIQPTTERSYSTGWMCTRIKSTNPNNINYLTELTKYTSYSETLFLRAESQIQTLRYIEQKWFTFLRNDKEQSIQLNKLNKPMRALVHQYSPFWNIITTSYDAMSLKQKRSLYHRTHQYQYEDALQMGCTKYIHCGKTNSTVAPKLLLSEAVKNWKNNSVLKSQLTIPSKPNDKSGHVDIVNSPPGFERKGIVLNSRTIPLELPPYQPIKRKDMIQKYAKKCKEKMKVEKIEKQRQKRIVKEAFNSDEG